jgi:hypothetical protein
MFTSGDIEFEAWQTKIYPFGPAKAFAMVSGDQSHHQAIATETHRMVTERGITEVKEVASLYAHNFATLRRKRAERLHLAPLGLDSESFIARQREINPRLILHLESRLQAAHLGVETIIVGAGSDERLHIYSVGGFEQTADGLEQEVCHETCHDGAGFYAIGSGARQFETQLMLARYSHFFPYHSALHLVYSAKKKAEVSPGVGRETDMFLLMRTGTVAVPPETLEALEKYHQELEKAHDKSLLDTLNEMAQDERMVWWAKPAAPVAPAEGGSGAGPDQIVVSNIPPQDS